MTNIELVLNMLAEVTTKLIQKEPNLKLLDSFFYLVGFKWNNFNISFIKIKYQN